MKYRILREGEVIQKDDEVDVCADGWRDEPKWIKASCIGQKAPNPNYPSHRIYRREE